MFETNDENGPGSKKYFGKYPGLVLKNRVEEGKEHRGELYVQVPGILEEAPTGVSRSDPGSGTSEEPSYRPMEAWAMPCFVPGFFFIPEEGSQVWVEFVAGNIDQPLWTGVWYPEQQVPKNVDDVTPTEKHKIIRTASGHLIEIDDEGGKQKIVITHGGGGKIEFDQEGNVLVADKANSFLYLNPVKSEVTLAESHGQFATLSEKNGVVLANKDGKVTLQMKDGKMAIISDDTVDIFAKNRVNLHTDSISLGGQGVPLLEDKMLFGDAFLKLYLAHTHATALGPSSSPLPPIPEAVKETLLSSIVKVRMK